MITKYSIRLILSTIILTSSSTITNALTLTKSNDLTHKYNSTILAQNSDTKILSLSDLPSGFQTFQPTELVPDITNHLKQIGVLLGVKNIKSEKLFGFSNDTSMIVGLTAEMPDSGDRNNLDNNLNQLKSAPAQQKFLSQVIQSVGKNIPDSDKLKISGATPISLKVGDASAASSIKAKLQGINGNLDMIAFRRNNTVAIIGIIYFDDQPPTIQLSTLATKLDQQLNK